MGLRNETPLALQKLDTTCGKSGLLLPLTSKVSPVPWATKGKYKVGDIICELSNSSTGEPLEINPRTLARRQLERLQSHGLRLWSSFELEGLILSKENLQPVSSQLQNTCIFPLSILEDLLYEFEQQAQESGILTENIHCEYDPAQIEFSLIPVYDIDCADSIFRYKEGFKEFCLQKGYCATFMTKPIDIESCNGAHFNFSLWTKDNKNAFFDPEGPSKLSKTCLYFIGGVLYHLKALCALCAPTINCYRRFHEIGVPTQPDWDIDNCDTALRLKSYGEGRTYIECRLPSGSANPYLVTAGVMAAGLDGIERQIEPPPKGKGQNPGSLPHSLKEALDNLRNDDVLKDSLGSVFVKWYLASKEKNDISRFGSHDMKHIKGSELQMERDEYLYHL